MSKQDFVNRTTALLQNNEEGLIEASDLAALIIANFDDHVNDAVSASLAVSFAKKPVLSIVNELPAENLTIGMRYFIVSGEDIFKVAEWKGANWEKTETKDGDQIFCISNGLFIVRNKADYNLSQVESNYDHPNHSGDVTSEGDGATVIAPKAVTTAKMADVASGTIFYRKSLESGPPEVKSLEVLKTDLEILGLKPVISICAELPITNLLEGERFFVISGEFALKIAEWNGYTWRTKDTVEGNSFYSYTQKNFIVRTKESYELAAGSIPFAEQFTSEITNEQMLGNCNGLNRIFRTSNPFKLGTIIVFVNGLNDKGFTVLDNQTIQFEIAPLDRDIILAVYNKVIV
ncbi:MAG: hypothetical protein NTZ33_06440 [Bacteroidetes bacterium]|nr:hypothetical protein [Bacteroidota bacterium]